LIYTIILVLILAILVECTQQPRQPEILRLQETERAAESSQEMLESLHSEKGVLDSILRRRKGELEYRTKELERVREILKHRGSSTNE